MFSSARLFLNCFVAQRARITNIVNFSLINRPSRITWLTNKPPTYSWNIGTRNSSTLTPKTEQENSGKGQEEEEDDILYRSIQIEARSADQAVLDSYQQFVTMAANNLGITIARTWAPFRTIKRRTLLRSAFVKKKYRVQYDFRTYYRDMEFKHLTGSTAQTFLEYIERNLPEGTALKVIKERVEVIPPHLAPKQ